jgi:drug/metabolite transporter (DMT)-like permease
MASLLLGIAAAVAASALFNLAVVVQASEARSVPRRYALRFALLARLVRKRRWLGGTALQVVAWPLQTGALLLAPLTVVQPADAAGLVLLLVFGSRLLGERIGRREKLAVAGIVLGVTGLVFVAPHRSTAHASTTALALALGALAVVAVAPYVLRRSQGVLVVASAGAAFAATAFSTKLIADSLSDADWPALVVLVVFTTGLALVGTLDEMTALQVRPATQVAPIIFVGELIAPVLLAMVLVREGPGRDALSIAVFVVSLGLVAASVIALGRSKAVAGMVAATA